MLENIWSFAADLNENDLKYLFIYLFFPSGFSQIRGEWWEHPLLAGLWEVPEDSSYQSGGGRNVSTCILTWTPNILISPDAHSWTKAYNTVGWKAYFSASLSPAFDFSSWCVWFAICTDFNFQQICLILESGGPFDSEVSEPEYVVWFVIECVWAWFWCMLSFSSSFNHLLKTRQMSE